MKVEVLRTHLSLWVSDPEVSARWYADILGMHESARGDSWIMMAFGAKHHDIALIRAEPGAHQGGLGLQHYGLEIAGDMTTLRQLYGMLLRKGVEVVKITDHEIGNGVYFHDPDGNRMEFFLETEHDDARGKARFRAAGAPSRNFDLDPL
ncbi:MULTISPECIES: VOC family protein [Pseudomonas]|uniref:Catechol-2,3-dioxygenase n=3 Tax=Pseudomonas TaxID=286 RepID=A0AAW8M8W3_9PSED|nr:MULTISPECIES: VOC family protein [Pseudomonas]MBC3345030.1 VOC family protein [Pseudomonas tehranensis]MBT2297453.1 VOC family protein [Pseudomonas fluorescens]MBT2305651.1 VOC family protein [Pseudomonas fluorescens]MBT2314326.1 VOC family protein [Pseudomonas fluorescens]MBT2319182.1 VOC family protein [Pseudomonas fluorescens]